MKRRAFIRNGVFTIAGATATIPFFNNCGKLQSVQNLASQTNSTNSDPSDPEYIPPTEEPPSEIPRDVPPGPPPPPPAGPPGLETVPVYQNSKSYHSGNSFVSSLSSVTVGEDFNVGSGPSTGLVVRVISHTGSGGSSINSFVIGGVTLTALEQQPISGFNANERLFYGVGLSLAGLQPWSVTVASATKISVQIFAARSVVTYIASQRIGFIGNTLNQSLTLDPNSISVGLLTSNLDSGVLAVTENTIQRWNQPGNFYQDFIVADGPSDGNMNAQVTGSAFTSSYLGYVIRLQGNVVAAPTWLPLAGQVATLTVANGKLTNNFRSQCAPYFEEYYFVRTSNTYGGCFKNPYWGNYGCALFNSGGHGNMNDNSVTIAEYGYSAVTFKRVCDPTPWFGTATDATTRGMNSAAGATDTYNGTTVMAGMDIISPPGSPIVYDYGISKIDGKPGSSHTYGCGDFVGPENGGAANGTYLRVVSPALNRYSHHGAVSALALDFPNTTAPSSARLWRKESLKRIDESRFNASAPVLTQYIPAQNRVYIVTNGNSLIRWFDRATGEYVTGTGVGFNYDNADGFDGGTLFYVPSRGLLVCAYRRAGVIEIQWMDVTVAQPTLGGTATLGASLSVLDPWGAATWCPDNNRIIIGAIAGDNSAVYEVSIPAVLSSTWTVVRAPFPAGQTLPLMNSSGEFKRFHYDIKLKAIFYFDYAKRSDQGEDVAYVYKPNGT